MPNALTAAGLTTSTRAELIAFYTAAFQQIYGSDITLTSDTPDGQMMNIFVQSVLDVEDLLMQVYNMFDPDNAIGVVLDQRVAINGIQRQAGTYTVTPVTIVNSASVNLYGLDQTVKPPYTVADNAGNRWVLQTTQLGLAAGTHSFNFQAAQIGAQLTIPNTINVPVTVVLGVTSINNPTTYLTLGINEESDANLKLRRQKSVSLSSQGYLAGLLAALENINGVTSAFVYENLTNVTNGDGVPGHSIWVIVAGTGSASDIADAIYTKRNAGCGMFGSTSFTVIQVDGSPFTLYWDIVAGQNLFMQFQVTPIDGVTPPNIAAIRSGLATNFNPGVYQEVNINELATLVQSYDPNTLVTNAGFSLVLSQTLNLSGLAASGGFVANYGGNASAVINWNDSTPTIQTKIQAIPGLSAATVSGSIASQTLTIALVGVTSAVSLITVTANTLLTSLAAPILFSFVQTYSNILLPSTKKNQFLVAAPDIIILPMQILPAAFTVLHATTAQYSQLGGYGVMTYSIAINNSGGTINPTTGLYTAGGTFPVIDTIQVTDALGNFIQTTVSVT
jgi:uncharacterized phage protein gp47/JayE